MTGQLLLWKPLFREKVGESTAKEMAELGPTDELNELFKRKDCLNPHYLMLLQYSFAGLSFPHSNPFLAPPESCLVPKLSIYYTGHKEIDFD